MDMKWAMVFCALCAVPDCIRKKIDGRVLLFGLLAGMAVAWQNVWKGGQDWYGVLLAAVPGLGLLVLGKLAGGRLGEGDGVMTLILGLFMGWERCLAVLCASGMFAAVFAGCGLALGRLRRSSRIPFAPFLLVATVLVWAAGRQGNL